MRSISDSSGDISELVDRQAALIEMSYEPILVWDMDSGIVEWNAGAERLYGFSRNEAIGKSSHILLRTVHPGGLPDLLRELERNRYWSGELQHVAKDGSKLIIESRQQLMLSGGRRLVLETNRDISERKIAEGILERYRILSEQSSDIIWFLDSEGNFVDVNKSAVETYGYSKEEFLSLNIRDLRHPDTLGQFSDQLATANVANVQFETVHVRSDGTSLPVEVKANSADFGDQHLVMAIVRDISERKRSEEALRKSEERRHLAQEAGNVGVWDWDISAGRTYWSEKMWAFYGEQPMGINPDEAFWSEHLADFDRERVLQHLYQTVASHENGYRDEFRIVEASGSIRWIESIGQVSRDPSGKAVRMYGVNLDITERKLAEERSRLSENQLRLVTNAVPALISYVDTEERYRFVNQKFSEWFGGPVDSFVGRKVRDVFGSRAYRILKPKINEALAGTDSTFESWINYETAGMRYVHASYVPDLGVDGTVYGFYGLTHDLTDLKRSQDLLRSSEDRIALLIDSLTDYAIFSLDTKGLINSWNMGAETIFGYTQDEVLGQPYDLLFSKEDIKEEIPQKEIKAARKAGKMVDERWHLKKGGVLFYASGVMMPLYVGEELTGYAKITTDLTERKQHAEQLERSHVELENRVRERTRELAETNTALLEEMAERELAENQRVELLRRLVSSQEMERRRIARDLHDQLGQRLTALRLKIASLKEASADNALYASRVQRLQEIAEKLDSEVSFLAWELRPTALDDLGLVDAVEAFVLEWSRHYEIPADFHSRLPARERLDKDVETHLYRITQEALNNIAKHAGASHVTVLLEKRHENLILIIEDNGVGFVSSEVRVSNESGRGLGLIGMSERATLVGGEVEIESSPGTGTAVYVRVPTSRD